MGEQGSGKERGHLYRLLKLTWMHEGTSSNKMAKLTTARTVMMKNV